MRTHTYGTAAERLAARQQEAIERQQRYNALTPNEKLAVIEQRRGRSAREAARIYTELQRETEAAIAAIVKAGNGRVRVVS